MPCFGLDLMYPNRIHDIEEQTTKVLTAGPEHRVCNTVLARGLLGRGFLNCRIHFLSGQGLVEERFSGRVGAVDGRQDITC